MSQNPRLDLMRSRQQAMRTLRGLVIEEIPAHLPEIQQLRMKLSQARALFLVMDVALTSLHEREVPRSMRSGDPNAHFMHIESRAFVEEALRLIAQAKDRL